MATFNKPIATNQGITLLKAQVAGSDSITFTKTVFSSDDYSQSADSDIANLTAIQSMDLTVPAQTFQDVNGNTKVRAVGYNNSVNQAFYIKTYALYAKNKAGNEILFAVASSQTADFVPAFNNAQLTQISYTFTFAIDQTQNITLSDQHEITVTQADIAGINNAVNSNASSLTAQQSSYASSLSSAFSSNATNTSSAISSVSSSNNAVSSSIASTVSVNQSNIATNSNAISSLQNSVATNSGAISNLQSSVANNSSAISSNAEDISSNATAISVINKQVINAVNTAMTGLRFMGDCPGNFLYQIQTPGIYNLAGKKYTDWGSQLWGQFIVIDAGGNVTTQFIYNNTSNCWVQTCNSWGNTGFKSIY